MKNQNEKSNLITAINFVNKKFDKNEVAKAKILNLLAVIEKDNGEQIKKLNEEEQIAIAVQLLALYMNLEKLFVNGVDFTTHMKLKKIHNSDI